MPKTEVAKRPVDTLIRQTELSELVQIDQAVRTIHHELAEATATDNDFVVALIQTRAIKRLQQLLSDQLIEEFRLLQGLPYGFMVDNDSNGRPKQYSTDVIRNCLIHALLYRLQPTGGQWGIIAGNMYIAAPGWERIASRLVNDLYIHLSVPEINEEAKIGLVSAHATFKVNGTERTYKWVKGQTFDGRLCVRHNKGMMPTAVLTKARRQCLRQLATIVMGLDIPDDPIEPMGDPIQSARIAGGTDANVPPSGELFPERTGGPTDGK